MKLHRARILAGLTLLLGAAFAVPQTSGRGVMIEIDGAIGAGTADYVVSALEEAAVRNAEVVILRMDTPGGLDRSMRDIIKSILASPVPVVGWVAPGGARADSAGTYILYATHVAAMAETTHLGAATPVSMIGGDEPRPPLPGGVPTPGGEPAEPATDEPSTEPAGNGEEPPPELPGTAMERKVLNDAIAYIRGLAEKRGRNAEWAEAAVREAATLTSTDALAQNVIEIIANDLPSLLEQLDGRTVALDGGEVTLETAGLAIDTIEPNWRQKLLSTIASPEIAILLMFAGIYGLVFEGWNPGAIVPGVIGAICLLLAAYALNLMPVNYVGVGLILLGIILITAEIFVPSFGALGIGGIASFVIGSIMMFDTGVPGFGISRLFVGALAGLTAIGIFAVGFYAIRLMRRGPVSGTEQILKEIAVAIESFTGRGTVRMEGEEWQAVCDSPVRKGQQLKVTRIDGLILHVEPLEAEVGGQPSAATQ